MNTITIGVEGRVFGVPSVSRLSPKTGETGEGKRSPGAVYMQVRACVTGSTRPFVTSGNPGETEMQSDNRCAASNGESNTQHGRQHDDQQRSESSRQGHQEREIDGKSPTERLGPMVAEKVRTGISVFLVLE